MFLFLIKKTFFDWWDNFFFCFLLNLGYLAVLIFIFSLPNPFPESGVASFLIFFLKIEIFFVYTGVVAHATKEIADYRSADWVNFFQYLKNSYQTSLLFGTVLIYFLFPITSLFTLAQQAQTLWELSLILLYFWIILAVFLTSQWFFPIAARFDPSFGRLLKKCFLFFIDNPVFSIGGLLGSFVLFLLSLASGFLLPGITAVVLWLNVAVKLRFYQYDYLESTAGANRRQIPWEALLQHDRETVGKRTLRSLFLPWRD